ncbi:M28 family peptidase [Microbacteriaceae bacterium K1510]|nr:M28 family peptidase [Microbacteriaceae bacterium K1510]
MQQRIADVIHRYAAQGFHRTGTTVDRQSGEWLAEEVRKIGLAPALEPFSLSRVDPVRATLVVRGRTIEGLPLFDGGFTGSKGVTGRLGPIGSNADIGLADLPPNAAEEGALGDARWRNCHRAMVAITRAARPGFCPSNADSFRSPFGPPVLQVASEEASFLAECAREGAEALLTAHVERTQAEAVNVVAAVAGADKSAAPVIVMTPRSGWWGCASERGGGIACWLEIMRAMREAKPVRNVLFVASSGHELGHLGIDSFIARRPGIVPAAKAWIHLGANIGAAQGPGNNVQASDDAMEAMLAEAMAKAGLAIDNRRPRGLAPRGEAENVHRGGGRYMSLIGNNALFHNKDDRGPDVIDADVIARFARVFAVITGALAGV